MKSKNTQKSALFALRAVLAFVLLGVLCAALYWWGYSSYPDVAEWIQPGHHEALVYDGATYYRVGAIGKRGLTEKKYPRHKMLGEVRDDGLPMYTEPVTEPETEPDEELLPEDETWEETEPVTELESVIPPKGAALFEQKKHVYVVYSVKDMSEYLLVLETDGKYYLYHREGADNPLAPETEAE